MGIRRELQHLRRDFDVLRGLLVDNVQLGERSDSEPVSPSPSAIPDDVALRFTDALEINKPHTLNVSGHLPLREAFDAMVYSFTNSTVEFNPRPGLGLNIPEEPQYLNLIKSEWLADKIEQSAYFRRAGYDSLWADYLRELKDDIREECRKLEGGDIVAPSLEVLLRLPDTCFAIWVVEQSSPRAPDLAEQRPFEEKILELALPRSHGSRQAALTIFRKSDIEFRLVSTTTDEQNQDFHREEGTDVHMNLTRFVPIYAKPNEGARLTHNVLLCASQAQNPNWYTLWDAKQVAQFQQALTGYRVSCEMSNVDWAIEGSENPAKSGKGKVQIWHHKPLPKMTLDSENTQEPNPLTAAQRASTVTSPQSPPLGRYETRGYSTGIFGATLVSARSLTSSASESPAAGTALLRPEMPVLIIFTLCEGRYTFIYIKREYFLPEPF